MAPAAGKATVASPSSAAVLRRLVIFAALLAVVAPGMLCAHGFHNAAPTTGSLEQWLKQVKQALPNLDEKRVRENVLETSRDTEALRRRAAEEKGAPRRPASCACATIQSTVQVREYALRGMIGGQCLEVLAFLDRPNIFPEEFPDFPLERIPEYRLAAKGILALARAGWVRMIAQQLRTELTKGSPASQTDMTLHPQYYDDLLMSLQAAAEAGDLSPDQAESLESASRGRKSHPGQAALRDACRRSSKTPHPISPNWRATARMRERPTLDADCSIAWSARSRRPTSPR